MLHLYSNTNICYCQLNLTKKFYKLRITMEEFKKKLIEFIFPPALTCSFCGREVFTNEPICADCKDILPKNDGFYCEKCGRRTRIPTNYCEYCSGRLINFDIARSAYIYDYPVNNAIQNLKYNNMRFFAREFAKEMAKVYYKACVVCDGITCVPMSDKRKRKRGYNQSALIAEALSDELGLPFFEDVIIKQRDTKSQVGLSQKERIINLSGSFSIKNRSLIKGKKLILVDDVFTTGTTVNLISEKLKNAGAEYVFALTVSSVDMKKEENNAKNA